MKRVFDTVTMSMQPDSVDGGAVGSYKITRQAGTELSESAAKDSRVASFSLAILPRAYWK